ncbi:hypothetical protein DUNSADRAFT_18434 [Dunaliella salina]|uniref:Encoded protein n=1 Tax=Dunaliella salina TaxID=3046 RepID=A0ABQ7G058_DUNSA|nr:hypothetical protein DUNSADRAFT_18434 [Dunaliella salina]|eukprot:KAF5827982.1 hypothetical protein DUNSADRAFT_18434 [Dunaliella salina]
MSLHVQWQSQACTKNTTVTAYSELAGCSGALTQTYLADLTVRLAEQSLDSNARVNCTVLPNRSNANHIDKADLTLSHPSALVKENSHTFRKHRTHVLEAHSLATEAQHAVGTMPASDLIKTALQLQYHFWN